MDVLLVNGPNLNLLGTRKPEFYGRTTLADVESAFRVHGAELGLTVDCFQSNHEGAIIDRIHQCRSEGTRFVVINPGAFTHTSVAIRDAFEGAEVSFVEVHISNVHARDEFRHHSYLSPIAAGIVVGCGVFGYTMALDYCCQRLRAT